MGRRFWSVWLLVALALQLSGVFHFTYVFFGLEADEIHGKIQQQQKSISNGSEVASSQAKQRKGKNHYKKIHYCMHSLDMWIYIVLHSY